MPVGAPRSDKHPRSVRLSEARWHKLQRLGMEWLERKIDRAPEPDGSKRKSE
ncbi:MAG: hypothetical protein JWR07_1889 [Nevskia sp.]|nr:hypothetical protein [Nevskia sp.]